MPLHLIYAALITGLVGGVHCLGMCGGIIAVMSAGPQGAPLRYFPSRAKAAPAISRPIAYHLGRIGTYSLFGALTGAAGSTILLAEYILPVQQALYVLAALMLAMIGAFLAGLPAPPLVMLERAGGLFWSRVKGRAHALLTRAGSRPALLAGFAWGAVPCALVYTALALALLAGSARGGALVMLAFGVGTTPHLVAGSIVARRASRLLSNRWSRRAAGLVLIALAMTGSAHALHLGHYADSIAAWCGVHRL